MLYILYILYIHILDVHTRVCYIYYIYYIKTFIEKYKILPYNDFNNDETYIF